MGLHRNMSELEDRGVDDPISRCTLSGVTTANAAPAMTRDLLIVRDETSNAILILHARRAASFSNMTVRLAGAGGATSG